MTKALTIREMSIEEFRNKLRKGIPELDLDVEIMALEQIDKSQDQHWILGMLRQLRIERSDTFEWMGWLEQAEDIWHFCNDIVELGKELTLANGETVIRERGKVHLWALYAHSWSEFCQTILNMPTEEARLREKVWDEFAINQGISRELLVSGRRSCLKRAVYFARLLREVKDEERLKVLHDMLFSLNAKEHRPATFRELNDWITEENQKIKNEATGRSFIILDYEEREEGGEIYLFIEGERELLGRVSFRDAPNKLAHLFQRGRELVRKRLERRTKDERELLEQI